MKRNVTETVTNGVSDNIRLYFNDTLNRLPLGPAGFVETGPSRVGVDLVNTYRHYFSNKTGGAGSAENRCAAVPSR